MSNTYIEEVLKAVYPYVKTQERDVLYKVIQIIHREEQSETQEKSPHQSHPNIKRKKASIQKDSIPEKGVASKAKNRRIIPFNR